MPKIEFELSSKSIDRAINQIKNYRMKVLKLPSKLVLKLILEGRKLAEENVRTLVQAEHTEIVANDIKSKSKGQSGKIYTTKQESTYAEMGIGIVGSGNPHPSIKGWTYDVNEHGVKGWWFFTEDPKLIKKYSKDGRGLGFTRGFVSQPYMYMTGKELRLKIPNYARMIIKEGE